jgi:hypothetical protein
LWSTKIFNRPIWPRCGRQPRRVLRSLCQTRGLILFALQVPVPPIPRPTPAQPISALVDLSHLTSRPEGRENLVGYDKRTTLSASSKVLTSRSLSRPILLRTEAQPRKTVGSLFLAFKSSTRSIEWVAIPAMSTIADIVARTSNRLFVGVPLCSCGSPPFFSTSKINQLVGRDPEYLKLNTEFTIGAMKAAAIINLFPSSRNRGISAALFLSIPRTHTFAPLAS